MHRGGYVLRESPTDRTDTVIIASGSEVGVALDAREALAGNGIGARVVSMPSWRLFSAQPDGYREEVLPHAVLKVSVEAGSTMGWERWVGSDGVSIGIDRFGASAPWQEMYRQYGITAAAVRDAVRAAVAAAPRRRAPSLTA